MDYVDSDIRSQYVIPRIGVIIWRISTECRAITIFSPCFFFAVSWTSTLLAKKRKCAIRRAPRRNVVAASAINHPYHQWCYAQLYRRFYQVRGVAGAWKKEPPLRDSGGYLESHWLQFLWGEWNSIHCFVDRTLLTDLPMDSMGFAWSSQSTGSLRSQWLCQSHVKVCQTQVCEHRNEAAGNTRL